MDDLFTRLGAAEVDPVLSARWRVGALKLARVRWRLVDIADGLGWLDSILRRASAEHFEGLSQAEIGKAWVTAMPMNTPASCNPESPLGARSPIRVGVGGPGSLPVDLTSGDF
jgi:hypothetical protein